MEDEIVSIDTDSSFEINSEIRNEIIEILADINKLRDRLEKILLKI